uniref:GP-PDE domain-containing protein n=1 Tax=Enterobius vermicularis TaxID=51028 RepID=A0A0N4VCP0_ENTVE
LFCKTWIFFFIFIHEILNAKKFFDGFHVGGHRGSPLVVPENTIESFKEALSSKMDLVEFDLALSKDGVAVIMHDDNLLRTCGVDGLVSSFTLEELAKHDAGRTFYRDRADKIECKIPTLKEVVEFCKTNKLRMLFDVKDGSLKMVSQIVEIIKEDDLFDQVIVSSFFPWVSYAVKKAEPRILTGITWRSYFFSYTDLDNCVKRFSGLIHYAAVLVDIINMKLLLSILPKFLGVEMMLTHEQEISGALVDRMKKQGIQVVAWTVNNKAQMMYYLDVLKVSCL